jgi:hypothetical protein
MYNEAISKNADIVSCKTIQHNNYGLLKNKEIGYIYYKEDFYNFINNKLIKRDIWSQTHYSPLRFREDINTLFRCLEFSKNTIKLNYAGYHYNLRPNSLTSTSNVSGKSYLYNTLAIIENLEFFNKNNVNISPICKRYYNTNNVLICYSIAKNILKEDIKQYEEECDIIETYIKENGLIKNIFDILKK